MNIYENAVDEIILLSKSLTNCERELAKALEYIAELEIKNKTLTTDLDFYKEQIYAMAKTIPWVKPARKYVSKWNI